MFKSIESSTMRRLLTPNTNFSSSINHQTRVKIISEARPLLEGHIKCKEIWYSLQVSDYKKSGVLNDSALKILLEKQGKNLSELLFIRTVEDLLELFDEDEDGFLNEDEQLLIFSTIKERMQSCSEDLCRIQEYNLFKDMMKAIRILEDDIYNYQKILRNRTQKKEISAYYRIGDEKIKKFLKDWDRKFEDFEDTCQEKMQELGEVHKAQRLKLEEEIVNSTDHIRIKPKSILKSLQVKEKLVAVNERYGEAQIIRNELKVLEVTEQNRVENLILKENEKKRKILIKKQEKETQFLLLKNREAYNALLIQKEQSRELLDKKIRLHFGDISKSQKISTSIAEKVAKNRDELRRTKSKSRKVQEYLSDARKSINRASLESFPSISQSQVLKNSNPSIYSSNLGYKTTSPLKRSINNITKFKITSESLNQDIPVNQPRAYLKSSSIISKSSKILSQYTKNVQPLYPLSSLYDQDLRLIY